MYRDEEADPPLLVCQVGSTRLTYLLRAIEDLPDWFRPGRTGSRSGTADEKKTAAEGTVEAWGRSPDNPVGGWYQDSATGTGAGSGCTSRPCWRSSAWSS